MVLFFTRRLFLLSALVFQLTTPLYAIAILDGPGNYDVKVITESDLESKYLNVLSKNFEADRQEMKRSLREMNFLMEDFIKGEIGGNRGVFTLSDQSQFSTPKGISLDTLSASVRNFELAYNLLETKIKSFYQTSGLKKYEVFNRKYTLDIPDNGIIDFTAVVKSYTDELKGLKDKVANLTFIIKLPNGTFHTLKGIDLSILREKLSFSAAELDDLRQKAARLRIMPTRDQMLIDNTYNLFTLKKMQAVIKAFGKSQRYRTQRNKDGLDRAIKDLEETFWTRSYLRATYGLKLGSFTVEYKKRPFFLDKIFSSTDLKFSGLVRNENTLIIAEDKMYNALETNEGRNSSVLRYETPLFLVLLLLLLFLPVKNQRPILIM